MSEPADRSEIQDSDGDVIDRSEVHRIAELCHLALEGEQLERMTDELAAILRYVRQLQAIDVEGVAPSARIALEAVPARADEPRASLPRESFLEAAPQASEEGFVVPAFVDEG